MCRLRRPVASVAHLRFAEVKKKSKIQRFDLSLGSGKFLLPRSNLLLILCQDQST
jgi:hypothetical protein